MMGLYDPGALAEAEEGFREFSRRFAAIAEEEPDVLEGTVRFLRSVPAADMTKKKELAKFFQTEAGGAYNREARKAAYDSLLGTANNRKTIG